MSKPRVTIVIPTFNRADLVQTCLESLATQTYTDYSVLIVDDGSTEPLGGTRSCASSFGAITSRSKEDVAPAIVDAEDRVPPGGSRVLRLDMNRGFAAAANAGIHAADSEFILLLNNDMTLAPDAIDRLVEALDADATLAAVGPLVLCADDSTRVYSAGDRLGAGGRPESIGYQQPRATLAPETPFGLTAGAALYRREIFDQIGGFDEAFIAYYEDADWCYRARNAGYGFALVPEAIAYHVGSASLGGRHLWRAQRCYQNHALLVVKNMPLAQLVRNAMPIARERLHQTARLIAVARCEVGLLRALGVWAQTSFDLARKLPLALRQRRRIHNNDLRDSATFENHRPFSTMTRAMRQSGEKSPFEGGFRGMFHPKRDDATTTPEVTVALLTRDAGPMLDRLLRALAEQKTQRALELLAVDSGSTDGTVERLQAAGARVLRIASDDFNFGATRDLAYQHARGAVVVNLSQDAVPADEYWLENLLAPLNDPGVAVACGHSIPDPNRTPKQFPWERNGYFYFTREMRRFARHYGRGVSFANSAVRRSVWEECRFDPQILGEDFQFQIKLQRAGLRAAFPEGAEVYHHHSYSTVSLYRRCRAEGAALRTLGCSYSELDLLIDLAAFRKNVQWLREIRHGRLHSPAGFLFPWLRPISVYAGSRFGANEHKDEPPRQAVNHG